MTTDDDDSGGEWGGSEVPREELGQWSDEVGLGAGKSLGWRESPRVLARAYFPRRATRTITARRVLVEDRVRNARALRSSQRIELRQRLLWEMLRRRGGEMDDFEDDAESETDFAGGTPGGEGADFDDVSSSAQDRVDAACWASPAKPLNVLSAFSDLCVYKKQQVDVLLKLFARNLNLDKINDGQGVLQRCVELGWPEVSLGTRKRVLTQMLDPSSRLVAAFDKTTAGDLVGFIRFSFTVEGVRGTESSRAVLTVHEMHVGHRERGRGLELHLIKLVSKIASFYQMDYLASPVPTGEYSRRDLESQGFEVDSGDASRMIYHINLMSRCTGALENDVQCEK